LKHRRLLVGSIIAIPIGVILWVILGPVVAMAGVSSHEEGWWIFSQTVTDITATYWVGVAISLIGLIVLIAGVTGIIVAFVPELLDRGKTPIARENAVSETTQ
jgi:hypothetical protein